MAIRFDADGDYLNIAASPGLSAFALEGWVYLSADRNATGAFGLVTDGVANLIQIGVGTDGTTLALYVNSGNNTGTNLSAATWYHVALVKNGTSYVVYLNGESDITRTDSTSFTPASILINRPTYWCNIRLAQWRVWSTSLTQAQVQANMRAYRPMLYGNLWAWWPMLPGATERLRDYSGNGRTLTANGTLTDEDGPALRWGAPIYSVPWAAASGDQTISPTGIASAEAFGSATITPGSVTVAPTGIPSQEAFGSPSVTPGAVTISPSGIASAEAFGNPTVTRGSVTVSPSGIASAEAFGTATVQRGAVTIAPSGIVSGEAFGSPSVSVGTVTISPSGIASGEAFGTAVIQPGAVTISPTGIASAEAFGTATVSLGGGAEQTIQPSGIASAEAFGTATVQPGAVTIAPSGIASAEAFGTATITPGAVTISPTGIASAEAFGTANVQPGVVTIAPVGIVSAEAFGLAVIRALITTLTPPERTYRVRAESRARVVDDEDRTHTVAPEKRAWRIKR